MCACAQTLIRQCNPRIADSPSQHSSFCSVIFPPLPCPTLPVPTWQRYSYQLALIVSCDDGNERASLALCSFPHSLWWCCLIFFFFSSTLSSSVVCPRTNLQVEKTKRCLLEAHSQYIMTALMDRPRGKGRGGGEGEITGGLEGNKMIRLCAVSSLYSCA